MVEDIDPHIIGITESWATIDISDAELGMTGYVMFRKDRMWRYLTYYKIHPGLRNIIIKRSRL